MIKNALINEDGSVIDFWGNEILPPDEDRAITYSKMKDFKNAWVNENGSVVKIVKVGGGGTGESTPNIAIGYDTVTGKVWVTDKEGKKESVNNIKLDIITDKDGNRLEEILNNISLEFNNKVDDIINNSQLITFAGQLDVGTTCYLGGVTEDKVIIDGAVWLNCNGQTVRAEDYPELQYVNDVEKEYGNFVKVMDSDNSNNQITQATSFIETGGSSAYNAFDGSKSTAWQSVIYSFDTNLNGDERIAIQLENQIVLGYYTLRAVTQANNFHRAPATWTLYGSNGVLNIDTLDNWEVLDSRNVTTFNSGQLLSFDTMSNKKLYRNYMIRITKILPQPNNTNRVSIAEINLFAQTGNMFLPKININSINQPCYMLAKKTDFVSPIYSMTQIDNMFKAVNDRIDELSQSTTENIQGGE